MMSFPQRGTRAWGIHNIYGKDQRSMRRPLLLLPFSF